MKMTRLEANVEINRPIRDVFEYASDWRHWEEWREGLSGLRPTTKIERGNNARYAYATSIGGLKFNLETEIHYFKENAGWQGIVSQGFSHKMNWLFENLVDKTKVTYVIEYSPPWFLIGPLLNFFILKSSLQRMLEKTLNNLKIQFEGSQGNKE
jgi:uncharacterized membrane protein